MNESRDIDRTLTAALRAVAADDEGLGASPEVEARLLEKVRSIARARRRRANILALAAAAALFIGIAVPGWYAARPASVPDPAPAGTTGVATQEVTTAFFPLAYSNVPAPDAHLIRLQVPRSALVSFGVTAFDSPGDSSTVLADVIVGDDGLARAVRFVRVLSYYEQQELQP